ncbi:MAG: GGDEF domain-containing protein [Desulfamplus sp.]|nr:GGDEF domain-containing protein [Desulfamplus sp.]
MTHKLSDHSLAQQSIAAAILAMVIMPTWAILDYFVEPLNFKTFFVLRVICVLVILVGLVAFIKGGRQVRYLRKFGLLVYVAVIMSTISIVIMSGDKHNYYLGFSTVFFAFSVLLTWPLRYFLIPMILSGLVLGIAEWHAATDKAPLIIGLFFMFNVGLISGVASWLTYRNFLRNEALLGQLNELSNTDRLTGISNRRYFDIRLNEELSRAARNDTATAILLLDIDHFKRYNDHYGHPQGDECLQRVAMCLRKAISREIDFVARYGGEEFVVVLADTDVYGAEVVAKRIINELSEQKIPHADSPVAPFVTASIGIACCKRVSAEDLVALSDSALYKAKQNGRNRYFVEINGDRVELNANK